MKKVYHPFLIFLISYVVIYLLVKEAPLYWVGGAIVASLAELFNVSSSVGMWMSVLLILGIVWIYFKARSKPIKYFVIVILFIMLYVIDIVFAGFITYDTVIKGRLVLASAILIKSIILSLVIFKDKQLSI